MISNRVYSTPRRITAFFYFQPVRVSITPISQLSYNSIYAVTDIIKGDSPYSIPCNNVNKMTTKIVVATATPVYFFAELNIAWWLHVTVAPELNSKIVFITGIPITAIVKISLGGHTLPILKTGDKLE